MSFRLHNVSSSERVDTTRISDAYKACDYLAEHHDEYGVYNVSETWGPEGRLYRSFSASVLLDAYRISERAKYIETARNILASFESSQLESGGWPLSLRDTGLEFKVSEREIEDSEEHEDPPVTATVLRTLAKYEHVTGSKEFSELRESAFKHIKNIWDPNQGTFREDKERPLSNLRENNDSYHIYLLLALLECQKLETVNAKTMIPRIIQFTKDTFESYSETTYPLMVSQHICTLLRVTDERYIKHQIRPRIDQLVTNPVFRLKQPKGGFGHHDGIRGITTSEAHIRNSCGALIAMKFYDLVKGTEEYRDSDDYREISSFVDSMQDKRGFFEYKDVETGDKKGRGSPAQFIPCYWIFGRI